MKPFKTTENAIIRALAINAGFIWDFSALIDVRPDLTPPQQFTFVATKPGTFVPDDKWPSGDWMHAEHYDWWVENIRDKNL